MSKQTIASVMEAKRKIAIQNVTDLLWQDKTADHIATVAIAGGLTVEKVQELECYVANAKAELRKLEAFDVAKLKKDAAAARAVFETADTDYKKVLAKRNEAAHATDAAAAALRDARLAFTEVADAVECNELPAAKAPKIVNEILTRRNAGEAIHKLEQTYKQLLQIKHDNEQIVENHQRQVDKIGTGGTRDNVTISSAGLIDEGELLKQRLQNSIEEQKSVEKAIAKCEKDITAAVAAYKKMQNPFSIEATEATNG